MKRALVSSILAAALASFSSPAFAGLSCEEIINMVNVNVPTSIVVQTARPGGNQYPFSGSGSRAQPAPARSALEDDEDAIGSRTSSRSSSRRELSDGTEEAVGSAPERILEAENQIKQKYYPKAAGTLYELLQEGTYPEQEARINYDLGRALAEMEMYHTAQYHFMKTLRFGADSPYFGYALQKMVSIARYTGDYTDLLRLVDKIPPEAYPRGARNHFYYLLGVRRFEEGKLAEASRYLSQISTTSELYLKGKYLEGVIFNQQGKLKSAARAFRDVNRTPPPADLADPRELAEIEELRQLALINVARIYYGIERFDESSNYYGLVNHDSVHWPEALFENAWANFMRNDLNVVLGQLLTVRSPFYESDYFVPEATLLRGLTFFNLCNYDDVEEILVGFEDDYRPIETEMRDFVNSYASKEGKELADQAWDTYFGSGARRETLIPKSLFNRILTNRDLQGLVRHLQVMDEEVALIDKSGARLSGSFVGYLKEIIDADQQRLKRRAGLIFLGEVARQANYISDLLTQSEIIRFEVVDAQRVDYQYKMQNADNLQTYRALELDFATSVDYIYWPFNGEFWHDELGYYLYTEQATCQ